MKKYVMVLSLLFFVILSVQAAFAQTATPTPVAAKLVQAADPTPTAKITQPTGTPAPTTAPTAAVTANPTPTESKATPTPQTQQSQTTKPTPTPTQITPTPTPKPLVLVNKIKPPSNPIDQIISAPFDLVMNSLPQSYYSDKGLAPATTRFLLALGLVSIIFGIVLLKWPSLVRAKNRLLAPTFKERRPYHYAAGRV